MRTFTPNCAGTSRGSCVERWGRAFGLSLREERQSLRDPYSAVVVAMRLVRKVQVPVDEIIEVVPVRNGFMAAAGPVAWSRRPPSLLEAQGRATSVPEPLPSTSTLGNARIFSRKAAGP